MISEISSSDASDWFEKLPAHRQLATLSPQYVCSDANRSRDLKPIFVLYTDSRGFWMYGFHMATIPGYQHSFDLQSPYGYGGPVSNCDDHSFQMDAWRSYQDWCQSSGVVVEFARLHPLAAWQYYPGVIVTDRQTVVVDLSIGNLRDQYEVRCRTAVRKAEKSGLVFQKYPISNKICQFIDFYHKAMTEIGASSFYFFPADYFLSLAKMRGLHLFVCEYNGIWMSAGLFLAGGDTLEYHLSATTADGKKFSATNLLIDNAAIFGKNTGLRWLYLGGGTDGRSDNSLLRFKTGFSPLRREYSYGYNVFDAYTYNQLRLAYPPSNKVIFYR